MTKTQFALVAVALAAFACVTSCTDKTTIVQNIVPGDQIKLTGEVRAWRCMVGDRINNHYVDSLFAVETGDTARIIIAYANGWCDTILTDSVSSFHRVVATGLHRMVIETRYTWPETLQVYLDRDTTFNFRLVYDVLDPDNITIYFEFPSYADTIGAAREWEALRRLNGRLEGALNTSGFTPRREWRRESATGLWMIWNIPLSSRRFNVLEVSTRAYDIAKADTARIISPVELDIHPKGIYMCLMGE